MCPILDFNDNGSAIIEIPQIGNDYSLMVNHWYSVDYQLKQIKDDLKKSDSEQRTIFLKKYAKELKNHKEHFQQNDIEDFDDDLEAISDEEREFYEDDINKLFFHYHNTGIGEGYLSIDEFELKHSLAWYLMNVIDDEIKKIETEIEKQKGLKICAADVDKTIKIIRESATPFDASINLMQHFSLSKIQAKAALELTLKSITSIDFQKNIEFLQSQKMFLGKLTMKKDNYEENLKYFKLANELNEKFSKKLLEMEAHFRGNVKSCSLISLNSETPEIGVSGIKTMEKAEKELSKFKPEKHRDTPEKSLQSWIILNAIRNNHILPFGDNLTFITSELAIVLENNKRMVNDILAINENNDLVVVELKSARVNQVKDQALDFKKIIQSNEHKTFFKHLTELMTGKSWSGNVQCVIVWKKANGTPKPPQDKYKEIEEYQYSGNYTFEKP